MQPPSSSDSSPASPERSAEQRPPVSPGFRSNSNSNGRGPHPPPTHDADQDAPPYDNRGHPSICFVVEQFRLVSGAGPATVTSDQLGGSGNRPQTHESQRTRVRVATCLRKDPAMDRRAWWNVADGVFMTKFVAEDPPIVPSPQGPSLRDPAIFSSELNHQSPSTHSPSASTHSSSSTQNTSSPWAMDSRGEVHLGDEMANLPQGVITSIKTTFNFPLAVSLAYLNGFTNGTHSNLIHRTALYYASDAPWNSLQRAVHLWVDVWRNATSGSTSS